MGKMNAVLVGLITPNQNEERTNEYLDELAFLADTNNTNCVKRFVQRLDSPNTSTYVGEGKLQEINQYVQQFADTDDFIDMVIFDDELSPRQLRNIEKALNAHNQNEIKDNHKQPVRVIDRTILILEIFLHRAQTSYAKTQVEMAHLQYMLPRLTRMWSHLDRQRGQNRGKMVRVALVGYTNVGKSTIMNLLSKSDVFAENKLFATLDTTVRKVTIENLPFLLSDTVGFIRKLPHHLVESFKSTLDEVREADLLIHVVDISHPNFEEQYEVVEQTINELLTKQTEVQEADPWSKKQKTGKKTEKTVAQIPRIVVFNKIDAFTYTPKEEDDLTPIKRENISLEELQRTWMSKLHDDCIFISARQKTNIDELKSLFYERIKAIHIQRYPYNDFLFQQYE